MKYMGSKRAMLRNGLGDTLSETVHKFDRFVDLFAGSGAVACHVAEQYEISVVANDLQTFSTALCSPILERNKKTDPSWLQEWFAVSSRALSLHPVYDRALELQKQIESEAVGIKELATEGREICRDAGCGFAKAYGGYYFSPLQACELEVLRKSLPEQQEFRKVALAALIRTASMTSASPGHTAQPFNPETNAGRFLLEAWRRPILPQVDAQCREICSRHSRKLGQVSVADANEIATTLNEGDLVFVDPPYSGVHYSRFYHVLETLARGSDVQVSGNGRYPALHERPSSKYSMKTTSYEAFDELLERLSVRRSSAIVTFPAEEASNGLSGDDVFKISEKYFRVEKSLLTGRFSTLGGNKTNRSARVASKELVLTLAPK